MSSSVDHGPMKTPPRCPSSKKMVTTTPSGVNSSTKKKKKTYPFRGNIRSPAPKADEILLRHLSSPEQQAQVIKERVNNVPCKYGENNFQQLLSGETSAVGQDGKKLDKLIQSSDNPKKLRSKFYDRMNYLKQIQKNDPDSFAELLRLHGIHPHGGIINDNGGKKDGTGGGYGINHAALKKLLMMQNDANEYEALAAGGVAAAAAAMPETVVSSSTTSTSASTARKIDFQDVEDYVDDEEENTENRDPDDDKAKSYRDNNNDVGDEYDGDEEENGSEEGDDDKDVSKEVDGSSPAASSQEKTKKKSGNNDITIDELNTMFQDLMSNMVRYHVQDIMHDGKSNIDENQK